MRLCRMAGGLAVVIAVAGAGPALAQTPAEVALKRDGTVEIAGRSLRCGSVRSVLDPRLPNLGVASPGLLVMNPRLLARHTDSVRLFVFHHECGHHHVGGSELKADCWGVGQGVQQGWLDRTGLAQVCKSFGNAPRTPTHPSASKRCANLERCFQTATAELAKQKQLAAANRNSAAPPVPEPAPKLEAGPTLVRSGMMAPSPP